MSEWQPIETAPKDETFVRLWRNTGGIHRIPPEVAGRWCSDALKWIWPDDSSHNLYTLDGVFEANRDMLVVGHFFSDDRFTHWMPLPTPPDSTP